MTIPMDVFLLGCSSAELEDYEERAAILEFDGGMATEQAEQAAMKIVLAKRKEQRI